MWVFIGTVCVCGVDMADYCMHCVCVWMCLCVFRALSLTVVCDGLDEDSEGAVISPALVLREC